MPALTQKTVEHVLFYHPESDYLWVETDPEVITRVYGCMRYGTLIEDVTGELWAEYRWMVEN